MPDYSKAKIYTIRCRSNPEHIYVGSTVNPLYKRLGQHKTKSETKPDILLYSTISNDWTDWYIELYEEYPCENKEQLCKREGEVIREIGTLNIRIEGRSKLEYRQENADMIKEQQKKYNQANADKIKEKIKEWQQNNTDRIKEQRKEYRKANADKIKEYNQEYNEQKADEIKEYQKEYHKTNAEKYRECSKKYYQANTDKIKEYQKANADKIKERKREYYQRKKLEKQQNITL